MLRLFNLSIENTLVQSILTIMSNISQRRLQLHSPHKLRYSHGYCGQFSLHGFFIVTFRTGTTHNIIIVTCLSCAMGRKDIIICHLETVHTKRDLIPCWYMHAQVAAPFIFYLLASVFFLKVIRLWLRETELCSSQ